jgi:hypothetical protein
MTRDFFTELYGVVRADDEDEESFARRRQRMLEDGQRTRVPLLLIDSAGRSRPDAPAGERPYRFDGNSVLPASPSRLPYRGPRRNN